MFGFNACRTCRGQDPTTDTVKVSFPEPIEVADKENAWPQPQPLTVDKENTAPPLVQQAKYDEVAEEEERERQRQEKERIDRERMERQLRLAENLRREEEQARQRAAAAERQRAVGLEEKKKRGDDARQQQVEEVRRAEEETRKREELRALLDKMGVESVNEKKKKSGLLTSGFAYPLHIAARANDAETLELLVWGGADKTLADSGKLTPLELAQKLDKKGSHQQAIAALSS